MTLNHIGLGSASSTSSSAIAEKKRDAPYHLKMFSSQFHKTINIEVC